MWLGSTRRDQPDQFVALSFVFDGVNNDDQPYAAHHASRSEPLLPNRELVVDRIVKRIAENLRRSIECDAMLAHIGRCLAIVPLEFHAFPLRVWH